MLTLWHKCCVFDCGKLGALGVKELFWGANRAQQLERESNQLMVTCWNYDE